MAVEKALLFATKEATYALDGVDDEFYLAFDLITSEKHNFKIDVTTHPVEEGLTITDFTQKTQEKGQLTGMITNFSLYQGEIESNRAQDAFDLLWSYQDNIVPVNIATTLRYYSGMIITHVSASRAPKTGEAQSFSISFQKLTTTRLATTRVAKNRVRLPTTAELNAQAESRKKSATLKSNEGLRVFSSNGRKSYFSNILERWGINFNLKDTRVENIKSMETK